MSISRRRALFGGGAKDLYIFKDGTFQNGFSIGQTYRGSWSFNDTDIRLQKNTVLLGTPQLDLSQYRYLCGYGMAEASGGTSNQDFYLGISPMDSAATPKYSYFRGLVLSNVVLDLASYSSGQYRFNLGTSSYRADLTALWLTNEPPQ